MKTMGLRGLVLVAPERFPHQDAVAMAAGAGDVLDSARVVPDLATAVADCRLVLGCTARSRRIALDELLPREAAARAVATAAAPAGTTAAVVFGRERTGLDNDELQLCHAAVTIPADPEYSSLNLAAAVQVLSYELRLAMLGPREALPAVPAPDGDVPASHAELEGFFAQLADTLDAIDFHKGRAPESALRKLRRIPARRARRSRRAPLRGVPADAQRMARLAAERALTRAPTGARVFGQARRVACLDQEPFLARAVPRVSRPGCWWCCCCRGWPWPMARATAVLVSAASATTRRRTTSSPSRCLITWCHDGRRGIREGRILMARCAADAQPRAAAGWTGDRDRGHRDGAGRAQARSRC